MHRKQAKHSAKSKDSMSAGLTSLKARREGHRSNSDKESEACRSSDMVLWVGVESSLLCRMLHYRGRMNIDNRSML